MGAGLLADDLAHGRVVMLIGDVAVTVHDLLHQIGGVQIAAVDAGRLGRDQGHGGDVEVLAEGVAGQVQLGEALGTGEHAAGLAVQIHAGALHETEVVHIFIELLVAQLQTEGDESGVAGMGRGLLQSLGAVGAGAVDGGVGHMDAAGASACAAVYADYISVICSCCCSTGLEHATAAHEHYFCACFIPSAEHGL